MMLSRLLAGLESIQALQDQQSHLDAWRLFSAHLEAAVRGDPETFALIPEITGIAADLQHKIQDLSSALQQSRDTLQEACDNLVPEYEKRGEEVYRKNLTRIFKTIQDADKRIEDVWDRCTVMMPDELDMLKGRLDAFNDWRVPGMIIGPGRADWIEKLVALDPLYLVDLDDALLHPCMKRFPTLYQQRLRRYVVDESAQFLLQRLPQAQIGVACAYDFFHVRPPRIIQNYLHGVWQCLRPGGLFVFTYSNGNHSRAADMIEREFACYTPPQVIRDLWTVQGFDTVFEYQSDLGWNYAEIRKPGVMTTKRGGQSLAKIRPIYLA